MKQAVEEELAREYQLRFTEQQEYRNRVWRVLTADFFQQFVPAGATILDLGSGWGEFVNHIRADKKYAMDMNPDGGERVAENVTFLNQDCSQRWELDDNLLDLVFTSNFFEHLPTKPGLAQVVSEAHRCLKPEGRIICLGPNIKYLADAYWDFWDHHIPLSHLSLIELLQLRNFQVEKCWPRFLPYTMVNKRPTPLFLIRWYLRLQWLWRFFGKQFLIVARTVK